MLSVSPTPTVATAATIGKMANVRAAQNDERPVEKEPGFSVVALSSLSAEAIETPPAAPAVAVVLRLR
jgi:hypothetical protein